MTKNLVKLYAGDEQYHNNTTNNQFYWSGITDDWKEELNYARQTYKTSLDPSNAEAMVGWNIYNGFKTINCTGYYSDIRNLYKTIFNLEIWYINNTRNQTKKWEPIDRTGSLSIKSTYNDNNLRYKVLSSICATPWAFSCGSFQQCLYTDEDQTITGATIYNDSSSTFDGSFLKMFSQDEDFSTTEKKSMDNVYCERHENPGSLTGAVYSSAKDGTEDTSKFPSVSSLGKINSDEIYLFCEKKNFSVSDVSTDIENVKFTDGIPLFYAKEGMEITWNTKVNSVSGDVDSGVASSDEVDYCLGYGPFCYTGYSNTNGYVDPEHTDTLSNEIKWWTTSSQAKKIKFTMDKDSWIYLKVKPHSLSQSDAEALKNWVISIATNDSYGKLEIVTE